MKSLRLYFTPKRIRIILIALSAFLLLVLGGLLYGLSIRGNMLDKALAKAKIVLKEDYGLDLEIGQYGFAGLTTVELQRVRVIPEQGPQLAAMEQVRVSVKLWPLLSKTIRLDRVDLQEAFVTLVKGDSTANYDFIFRRREKDTTAQHTPEPQRNLAQLADRLIKQAFDKIPSNMDLDRVEVSYQDSTGVQRIRIPEGKIRHGRYAIDIYLNEHEAKWHVAGRIDRSDQQFSVTLSSEDPALPLPLLQHKYGLRVHFDQVSFDLKDLRHKGTDQLMLVGEAEFKGLQIHHRRLSHQDVNLPHILATGGIVIADNSLEIMEGTRVEIQKFTFEPHLRYQHSPAQIVELSLHTGMFPAQHLFDAIPSGLFPTLEGIEVEGDIAYDMDFKVDLAKPDELTFQSQIDDRSLQIKKWGSADIAALNADFVHEVYEDTVKLRDILIGRGNPNFTPLQQIAPILQRTVLNTEDPFFYEHKGFEEEAFKLSIATNIKEKGFKRGASTISMQLVKNLYLNRNKTMMRKFEEILLVWLMEQSRQVSKDRLLEIYFNGIEWGKGIYGIREATQYYFGKEPADVTLGESLYLSSIIPRPKTGLSSFDYTGYLKPWVQRHFNTYGYILNKRGLLHDVSVPESYGFYTVVLQPHLRPPRPRGVVDSIPSEADIHDMADEIDLEESRRKTLLEKLFGSPSEENK